MQGDKSTYQRNGTTTLFAALEVAIGKVIGKTSKTKTRKDFPAFMDEFMVCAAIGKVLHVVIDNLAAHNKCHEWLARHSGVEFHYTPTSASWLNQVEIWFGIFTRTSLKAYNQNPVPFAWNKRAVRGPQLRNTARNFAN